MVTLDTGELATGGVWDPEQLPVLCSAPQLPGLCDLLPPITAALPLISTFPFLCPGSSSSPATVSLFLTSTCYCVPVPHLHFPIDAAPFFTSTFLLLSPCSSSPPVTVSQFLTSSFPLLHPCSSCPPLLLCPCFSPLPSYYCVPLPHLYLLLLSPFLILTLSLLCPCSSCPLVTVSLPLTFTFLLLCPCSSSPPVTLVLIPHLHLPITVSLFLMSTCYCVPAPHLCLPITMSLFFISTSVTVSQFLTSTFPLPCPCSSPPASRYSCQPR